MLEDMSFSVPTARTVAAAVAVAAILSGCALLPSRPYYAVDGAVISDVSRGRFAYEIPGSKGKTLCTFEPNREVYVCDDGTVSSVTSFSLAFGIMHTIMFDGRSFRSKADHERLAQAQTLSPSPPAP